MLHLLSGSDNFVLLHREFYFIVNQRFWSLFNECWTVFISGPVVWNEIGKFYEVSL